MMMVTIMSAIALIASTIALYDLRRTERRYRTILRHLAGLVSFGPPEVVEHLINGERVKAVVAYQAATGINLADARLAVGEIARRIGL